MRYKKRILVLTLTLILVFSVGVMAGPQDKIEDMNFKNTDVVDVFRTIAEAADVNLIAANDVSGDITIHLKDITFEKAIELITQSRDLDYEWDENTVVIASPDRIESIYENIVTEYVEISSGDFDNIATIVKEIFPETQITTDTPRQQFIIKGEEENVAEIKEMVSRLDSSKSLQEEREKKDEEKSEEEEQEEESVSESYKVLNAELDDLEEKIEQVFSEIEIKKNSLTETITISGREENVAEALSMIETYDQSLEAETRNIRVDHVDREELDEILEEFYSDMQYYYSDKRKEVVMQGPKNKLDNVEDFIKEINNPAEQVLVEIRVEEITTDLAKELGVDSDNLSTVEILEDNNGQIEGLEMTWPNLFEALNTQTDSKTLARPSLMTLNGKEASMSILDEESYQIRERNDDGTYTDTYEYAEAGVKLRFTPWITENDEIELEIMPEVSSFSEVRGDSAAPPDKKTREVQTTLRLKNNETFAIGGLIQSDNEGVVTKIPLLGDIPILGEIFKSRESSDTTNELVVFVTPRIIEDDEGNINKEETGNSSTGDNSEEKEKDEIIAEYLEERSKSREEIMASLREGKEEKDKSFKELTPEELEEILNN